MKKKLRLSQLTVSSFNTSVKYNELKGGATPIYTTCYTNCDKYSNCNSLCVRYCNESVIC